MILINLMPHRQRRLHLRRRRFYFGLGVTAVGACLVLLIASAVVERLHQQQLARNAFLEQSRGALQTQEARVLQIKAEIKALLERERTVGNLQSQRNVPVDLANELALRVPAGVALTALRQNDQRVALSGLATSDERVSEFLLRLQNESPVVQQAELVEMRLAATAIRSGGAGTTGGNAGELQPVDRGVEFTLTLQLRPLDDARAPEPRSPAP